jgi:glyceraldehyde-3-phosphate dehydrogenase (NADP+)
MAQPFENLFLKSIDDAPVRPPYVEIKQYLVGGELKEWKGDSCKVYSPIILQGKNEKVQLGTYPMQGKDEALEAVNAAYSAYDHGRGKWPRLTPSERIKYMKTFLEELKKKRDDIVNLLMWEICKVDADAKKEFDRTIQYIQDTIKELKDLENKSSSFTLDSGIVAQIRRAPLGVVLCMGPFNYPFNETYTTLIPALIMGNSVVMKLPRTGVLCHQPTFEVFQKVFPPGVVNIIAGAGRATVPPIMQSGKLDVFAFIGTSKAADELQKAHPKPHRLRICLGLEAKNPAIILPDADMKVTISECLLGTLSFNGQRCTALKILFVHESIADSFVKQFSEAVDALKMGLPWEKDTKITPLPEPDKPKFLQELIEDAVAKGAKIVNQRGGQVDRTLVAPTVVFPVNSQMKLYHEEQFGPVVPVVTFKELDEIFEYMASSPYGQQASIFGKNSDQVASLVDVLVNQVARVNLNTQCQRGPDNFPFTGRKDSAYGTLSVFDALRVFSIRALLSTKEGPENQHILSEVLLQRKSSFLRMDYLF